MSDRATRLLLAEPIVEAIEELMDAKAAANDETAQLGIVHDSRRLTTARYELRRRIAGLLERLGGGS